ncbi:MAG: RNA methyltransferase [Defluviitaleaceae bacterium]|nr:RNA methyltransferase [Defluviitaleaceae bacterium]
MAVINSVNNFRVKQWIKLKNKPQRDKQRQFIAEGYHLVSEAYKAGRLLEFISLEKDTRFDVPSYQVTYEVMERLTSMATSAKALGICARQKEGEYGDVILLADQIHHPGNLGTIIRSAVAFGVDTIALANSVDVYNPKVIQASQGMLFHINIINRDMKDFLLTLKDEGYQIIGTDVREGVPLRDVKPNTKRAILIGNEGDGLGDGLLNECDIKVNIKMNDKCESLNVGVAASIILYGLSCIG